MTTRPDVSAILRTTARLLTFRATSEELQRLDGWHLAFGLFCTWLAGVGRSWDNPQAELLQRSGIGSLVYVFALSGFLWIIVAPLGPRHFSYRGLLTFVCLTAPPALLYAVPVERFFDAATARNINAGFLAFVAAWRVALLAFYLMRSAQLNRVQTLVATLLPLSLIVSVVAFFNAAADVMRAMDGVRQQSSDDPAQQVLRFLVGLAGIALLPLLLAYSALVADCVSQRIRERRQRDLATSDEQA